MFQPFSWKWCFWGQYSQFSQVKGIFLCPNSPWLSVAVDSGSPLFVIVSNLTPSLLHSSVLFLFAYSFLFREKVQEATKGWMSTMDLLLISSVCCEGREGEESLFLGQVKDTLQKKLSKWLPTLYRRDVEWKLGGEIWVDSSLLRKELPVNLKGNIGEVKYKRSNTHCRSTLCWATHSFIIKGKIVKLHQNLKPLFVEGHHWENG